MGLNVFVEIQTVDYKLVYCHQKNGYILKRLYIIISRILSMLDSREVGL